MPDNFLGENFYGYQVRNPFPGEMDYFKNNAHVAGMAAEDGKITLNPYSMLNVEQRASVAKNEAIRLWMKDNDFEPKFNVTPAQLNLFKGSDYSKPENVLHLKHTLISRYLTGDPSAGELTPLQKHWAEILRSKLPQDNQQK